MSQAEVNKHLSEFRITSAILKSVDYKRVILSDSPDIELETKDGRWIGIEVTNCLVSSIRSKNKNNRTRVLQNIREAEETYKEQLIKRGETNISIRLSFTDMMFNAPQKEFTAIFIDEIERHRRNDWMEHDFYKRIGEPEFRDLYNKVEKEGGFKYRYIESIECCEHPSLKTQVYHLMYACISGKIQEGDICERIKDKEMKISRYKQLPKNAHIDEYWLVINIPVDEHYTIYDDFQLTKEINSEYDKIYLIYPFDEIISLK